MLAFFQRLLSIEKQRQMLLDKVPKGALREYLSQPFVTRHCIIKDIDIVAVDFETTGLNSVSDKLLSIGCVNIKHGRVDLQSSFHQVIAVKDRLDAKNVAVHQITDYEKSQGVPLKTAIDELLTRLAGKVMLVHFGKIEREFLSQACFELYGVRPPFCLIDTLVMAKHRLDRTGTPYDPASLRLANLRSALGLPSFHGHNALNDAIATAELFLVELSRFKQGIDTRLEETNVRF